MTRTELIQLLSATQSLLEVVTLAYEKDEFDGTETTRNLKTASQALHRAGYSLAHP